MYIILIGWLYVIVLMAAAEASLAAGLLTLVFYGLAPVALFLWIFGTPARRRARIEAAESRLPQQAAQESTSPVVVSEVLGDIDRSDTQHDQ
ncbi:MAG TPA: hypothetical protein VL381_05975 [Rhodocyclaceae bacterium]|jgi:hypothetical protein|nr:hypothetical protein [Rhodocyclaceae bacterium]